MRIHRLSAGEVDEGVRDAWRRIQATHPIYANPYYSPEYTTLVGRLRPRVYVAVIEQGGRITGVFPYESDSKGRGRPVGFPVTDYQGLIAIPEADVDAKALLKACGLYRWDFDHVPAFQSSFAAHADRRLISPGIRIDEGFEAYIAGKNDSGSNVVKQTRSRRRRLGREVGEVRFEAAGDGDLLNLLTEWKSDQYRRTGIRDVFALGWTRELVKSILDQKSAGLRGLLSVLWAGDRPVALHMGMRSESVLHWWFPAHDQSCAKCSPGVVLLLDLIEHAANSGVTLIDLGRDVTHHKRRFENSAVELMVGSVHLPSLRYGLDRLGELAWETLRKAPMPKLLRTAGGKLQRRRAIARLR